MIDFNQELKAVNGKTLNNVDESGERIPLKLGDVVINALMMQLKDDDKLSGKDKLKMRRLAERVNSAMNGNPQSFEAKQTVLMIERLDKVYGANVYGAAAPLIDPEVGNE